MALRIKASLLMVLTVTLGTALAMSASERKEDSGDVVGAVTKDARARVSSGGVEQTSEKSFDLSALKRPKPKGIRTTQLFDSKSWYTPPVQPAQTAPAYVSPPQPTTPALPFTFIGRMIDRNVVTLFLAKSDRQYTVKESDVLDDIYRVDKIREGGAVLTYLPTNTQQTLPFNSTLAGNAMIGASEANATMRPAISTQQPFPN